MATNLHSFDIVRLEFCPIPIFFLLTISLSNLTPKRECFLIALIRGRSPSAAVEDAHAYNYYCLLYLIFSLFQSENSPEKVNDYPTIFGTLLIFRSFRIFVVTKFLHSNRSEHFMRGSSRPPQHYSEELQI